MGKPVTLEPDAMAQPRGDRDAVVRSRLPERMQEQFAVLFPGHEPATLGEWVAALGDGLVFEGPSLSAEDLCFADSDTCAAGFDDVCAVDAEDPKAHTTHVGEESYDFCCIQDSLVVSFLVEDPVVIESTCPVTGTELTVRAEDGELAATPADAVVSFGVAEDLPDRDFGEMPGNPYDQLCPFVALFASRSAYEEWAADEDRGVTAGFHVEDAYEAAHEAYVGAQRQGGERTSGFET